MTPPSNNPSLEVPPTNQQSEASIQLKKNLEKAKIQKKLFKLITEQGEETQKILNYLDKHKEFFHKSFPIKELWPVYSLPPNENIASPYLYNVDPYFLSECNYFHLAIGCLCEPVVLEKLRVLLDIDLNHNFVSLGPYHHPPAQVGVTAFFLQHTERDPKTLKEVIVPQVKNILTYLGDSGYDFQNDKELQLLSTYQVQADMCGPEIKEFAQHIEILIEKQMIKQQLPEQIQNEVVGQLNNKIKTLKI